MSSLVSQFKALSLEGQITAFGELSAALAAAKESRRAQLEAEIRALGFTPGESKKTVKAKYRGPNGEVWSGVGAMATWLRKLKEAGEDIERYKVKAAP